MGQWSCWTEWSRCSVSCGIGVRTRKRECLDPHGCEGHSFVQEFCELPSCESLFGWDSWSDWSNCNINNQQRRKRKCLQQSSNGVCQGASEEIRDCLSDYLSNGELMNN